MLTLNVISPQSGYVAVGEIVNDKTGNMKTGNYTYELRWKDWDGEIKIVRGKVRRHNRKDCVWKLVKKVLNKVDL